MKSILSTSFILFIFSLMSFSQTGTTVLKGRVIDQEKNEGIAFVSIGIEGTSSGAASNPDGFFELKITEEQKANSVNLSAIGYQNARFTVSELIQRQSDLVISLVPQSYDIESVDVAAESKVILRILRTASERIPKNYLSGPMNMKIYYEKRSSVNSSASTTLKTIVDLFDADGYAHPSWTNAFKKRSYRITEAQTPSPFYSFSDATNSLDEMLEMDILRLSGSLLNPRLIPNFKLKMDAKTKLNGDSVWIITYEALKLDLAHTGSYYPTSFKGKIHITCADYAVVRNEINLSEAKENEQGRSLALKNNQRTRIQMNVTTGYKKVQGKYVLAFVDSEKQFTSAEKQSVYESGKIVTLAVETTNLRSIKGRDYVPEVRSNEGFWQKFELPSK